MVGIRPKDADDDFKGNGVLLSADDEHMISPRVKI
jgi:hypothetical protein